MFDAVHPHWLDPNLLFVALGTLLIGITAGVMGSFTLLRKQALIGDGVAHAVLPGVVLAYMFTGDKDPWILFLGSVVAGWLSLGAMRLIEKHTRLSADTAVGIVLSVFFGIGVMLLGIVQRQEGGGQSGLDKFLFGQAASLLPEDVAFLSIVCAIVLVVVFVAFKELRLRSFDPAFARSLGYDHSIVYYLETALLVMVLTTGLQAVGVILMAAVLIIPAATARYWSDQLEKMLLLSALFGALAGLSGTLISYVAPAMPTGPWMVVASSFFLFASMIIAPKYGTLSRWLMRRRQSRRIDDENVIKTLWLLMEKGSGSNRFSLDEILQRRPGQTRRYAQSLKRMEKRNWVISRHGLWQLSETGYQEASRLVRAHRLWETYLTELLQIADDHVHDDAETMEHLITPEIEALLAERLGYPLTDPHQKVIPYAEPKGEA